MDEEEEEDAKARVEKEVGPPLLTPLSEDAIVDGITSWTALQSSRIQPDQAVALIRSNVWPGAFAFACGKCVHASLLFNNDFPLSRRICDIYVADKYKFPLGYRRNSAASSAARGRFYRGTNQPGK